MAANAATLDPRATPEDDGGSFRFAKFANCMAATPPLWIPPEPSRPAEGGTAGFGENDGAGNTVGDGNTPHRLE